MDLLRLPWNGGNQRGRRQFPIDQLFRRDDRAPPQARGGGERPGVQPFEGDDHSLFQVPRSRESKVTSPLQKVLDELNMSILPHNERLNAIVKAAEHFDHRDRARHDYELHEGAARILYQKLALVLTLQLSSYNTGSSYFVVTNGMTSSSKSPYSSSSRDPSNFRRQHSTSTDPVSIQKIRSTRSQEASDVDYEIALLTTCLELVHRAAPSAVANAWFTIGEECLPILVKLLERPFHKIQSIIEKGEKNHQSASAIEKAIMATAMNKEMKVTIQKVTKLLAVYSLIPDAKVKMTKCPGLLAILVKITDTQNMNRMKSMRPVPKRLLASKANSVTDFDDERSAWSSSSQSTKMLGSVMDSSTASASNGVSGNTAGVGLYMTEASRFNAIATFTNLASVEKNRMIMLSEPGLVNNIARVVHNERSDVARQCSALAIMYLTNGDREHVPELAGNDLLLDSIIKLTKDEASETRRNAIIAMFNVACADENTVKLVRFKDGIILDVLMNIIGDTNDVTIAEVNEEIRVTAAEAMFNISCSSIVETTDRFANHPNLLETCALVLKSYVSIDVKVYCAAILKRMAEIIHYPKKSQSELLRALVKASSAWTRTACIAEGFLSQAMVKENRQVMAEHHGLLNSLSNLACVSGEGESDRVRRAAVSAIEHLSRETGRVRELLSKHEGIMLAMTHASYGQKMSNSSASVHSQYSSRSVDDDASQSSTNRNLQLAWKRLVEMI